MKPVVIAACCVATFGLGVAFDRFLMPGDPEIRAGESTTSGRFESFSGSGGKARDLGDPSNGKDDKELKQFKGSISDLVAMVSMGSWEPDAGRVESILGSVSAAEMLRLVQSMDSLDETDPRTRAVRRAVYERFAELDPQAALAMVQGERDHELKERVVRRAFEAMARQDLSSALAAFADIGTEDMRHRAVEAMAEGIDPKDVKRLAEFVQTLPEARHFGDFLSRWAQRDPASATSYTLAIDDSRVREEWLRAAAQGWARTDPENAIAWIETLGTESDMTTATEGVLHSIMRTDPVTASKLLAQLPNADRQREFAGELALLWAQTDTAAAREWVESLSPAIGRNALRGMLDTWTRTDPAAAAEYLSTLPPNDDLSDAMHEVARRWAGTDLEAAVTWANETADIEGRRRALDGVANEWARLDPATAAEFANTLSSPDERREVMNTVGHNWARQDLNAALDWALTLSPADRGHASRGILDYAAQVNPGNAVDMLGKLTASMSADELDNSEFNGVAGSLAERWSEHSPVDAAAWAESLPDGSEMQREALENVADQWVELDSMAASKWISELPYGEQRDAATAQLVREIDESDPASAFQWAVTASDEGLRAEMMHEVLEDWQHIDPGAARASLDAAAGIVTPEQFQELGEVFER